MFSRLQKGSGTKKKPQHKACWLGAKKYGGSGSSFVGSVTRGRFGGLDPLSTHFPLFFLRIKISFFFSFLYGIPLGRRKRNLVQPFWGGGDPFWGEEWVRGENRNLIEQRLPSSPLDRKTFFPKGPNTQLCLSLLQQKNTACFLKEERKNPLRQILVKLFRVSRIPASKNRGGRNKCKVNDL